MRSIPKITPGMCDNLGESYSKYDSPPRIFVKVRHNLVEAGSKSVKKTFFFHTLWLGDGGRKKKIKKITKRPTTKR